MLQALLTIPTAISTYAPMCSNHRVISIRILETRTVSLVQAKGETEQDLLSQAGYPNKYVRCFQ
jgi:hypothetical protein